MSNLRDIPGINTLLEHAALRPVLREHGHQRVTLALQSLQNEWRHARAAPDWCADAERCAEAVSHALTRHAYRGVFNLTGTVIHTNLGRAPLSQALWESVGSLVTRPMTLEFDLENGRRGHRETAVAERLCALTGAEAATVVNNNAAALMLTLNTFARSKEVPVSRGELIEIGGSFRLPELINQSGCVLREIGTTNRTHLTDYEAAVNEHTGCFLKIHPSNYHIQGFTHTVARPDLVTLAQRYNLPLCEDLGSGSLVDLSRYGLPREPTPREVLDQGVDVVTFSGDKLLGSMQAGLIVGRRALIDALNANPMKRAMRADKVTLAYLEQSLALFDHPDRLIEHVPALRMLAASVDVVRARALKVRDDLRQLLPECTVDTSASHAQIGSGAQPDRTVPSHAVVVTTASSIEQVEARFRALPTPVIGRIHKSALWLDMRAVEDIQSLRATLAVLSP